MQSIVMSASQKPARSKSRTWAADDPRLKKVEAKKEVILDAALEVFMREGFSGASMERVAAAARVSKMTLYRHYKTKEELFLATINRRCDEIYNVEDHEPAASRDAARFALHAFGKTFVETIIAPDVQGLFQMLFGETPRFPEIGRRFYDAAPARTIVVIERILSGVMPHEEARARAAAFMHMLMGDTYQRLALRKINREEAAADFEKQINLATDLVLSPPA